MKLIWLSLAVVFAATCTEATKTFKVVKGSTKSYAQWETECGKIGGTLAFIESAQEQADAAEAIKSGAGGRRSVLLAIKRDKAHGTFFSGDDKKLAYSNWNRGEPNDWGRGEQCVEVYSGSKKWNDIACRGSAALCQFGRSVSYVLVTSSNWLLGWSSGEFLAACKRKGGTMATIYDESENALALAALTRTPHRSAMIGVFRRPGHFVDVHNEKVMYSNWSPGEPNNAWFGENCVEMYRSGKWNDIKCRRKAGLCEI